MTWLLLNRVLVAVKWVTTSGKTFHQIIRTAGREGAGDATRTGETMTAILRHRTIRTVRARRDCCGSLPWFGLKYQQQEFQNTKDDPKCGQSRFTLVHRKVNSTNKTVSAEKFRAVSKIIFVLFVENSTKGGGGLAVLQVLVRIF